MSKSGLNRRIFVSSIRSTMLVVFLALFSLGANAQVLMTEDFNYELKDLYSQGSWVKYGTNSVAPIQVISANLTYEGYPNNADVVYNAVEITSTASGQDLQKQFTTEGVKEGAVYVSALMNFKSIDVEAGKEAYFFNLVAKGTSAFKDGGTGLEFAKLYVKNGDTPDKFYIGVSRNNTTIMYSENQYSIDETYLVVLKYEIKEGDTNDEVSVFVNPAIGVTEPSPAAVYNQSSGSDVNTARGFEAIELRQGQSGSKNCPNLLIGAIRVAQSYGELFGLEPVPTPEITLSKKMLLYNYVFQGETNSQTVNVKGKNLTDDITITSSVADELKPSVTTIPKEQAESEDGFDLTVSLVANEPEGFMGDLLFSSEGATDAKLTAYWEVITLTDFADIKTLRTTKPAKETNCRVTGDAIITYIYKDTQGKTNYCLQDGENGLRIRDAWDDVTVNYKVGDKIRGLRGVVETTSPLLLLPISGITDLGTKVSSDNPITPIKVTLKELADNPDTYESRLIEIENITVDNWVTGAKFETDVSKRPEISDGTGNAQIWVLTDMDFVGMDIPFMIKNLIGVSTLNTGKLIAPRSSADIIADTESKLEITPDVTKFDRQKTNINEAVELGRLTVVANQITGPVVIEVTGTDKAYFQTSVSEIPAGNSKTEVIVTYNSSVVALHQNARLTITCDAMSGFYKAINLSGVAIDPANPPTLTVNSSGLVDYSVEAEKTQEQTITFTTTGLPDYLNVAVMHDEGSGDSFRISSTQFPKVNTNQNLVITFAPKVAGTFVDRIKFSSIEMEDFYLTVKGVATPSTIIPEKEGDELPLDVSNPRILLNEHFDNVTSNKPLKIDGWKNLAQAGLRAWWGYEHKNESGDVLERSAKVTAYVMNATEAKSHDMLLVTPALDYKNAASKMFTFRVMGTNLFEGQPATLELCYLDMKDGELYINPQAGVEMPSIADENGEWYEYHIDLAEAEGFHDVFFMGFRFKGVEKESSAIYYIDDVSYGRTDLPTMTSSAKSVSFTAKVNVESTSDNITITAKNLTEPIKLVLDGANPSKFKLSTAELPATGGSFNFTFASDQLGVHDAYIKVSSRGAADLFIPLSVNNTETGSGIDQILAGEDAEVFVYDFTGRVIMHKTEVNSQDEVIKNLNSGNYIIKAISNVGSKSFKVIIP